MVDWNDWSPLTKEEWIDFVKLGIPEFKEMEHKNSWDFYINDFSFSLLCNNFLCYAYDKNAPEDWQDNFQKVKDLMTIWELIDNIDWSEEERKYREDETKRVKIYELIIQKVFDITDEIFNNLVEDKKEDK